MCVRMYKLSSANETVMAYADNIILVMCVFNIKCHLTKISLSRVLVTFYIYRSLLVFGNERKSFCAETDTSVPIHLPPYTFYLDLAVKNYQRH